MARLEQELGNLSNTLISLKGVGKKAEKMRTRYEPKPALLSL